MLHAILCLLPVVALSIPMIARRYVGERVLVALRRERHLRWPRPGSSVNARRGVVLVSVRGGLLMGRSLAVRPPPA